jgi:hypothetical protein
MTPGAAQALLKGHGVLAGQSVVVAGTGFLDSARITFSIVA